MVEDIVVVLLEIVMERAVSANKFSITSELKTSICSLFDHFGECLFENHIILFARFPRKKQL
jgi:hypothetical protein